MQGIKVHDDNRMLGNSVQLDDTYIEGKKESEDVESKLKTSFVSAISLNEVDHPIYMRLSAVSCFKKEITD